jgi:hypothetical protein
VNSPPVRVLSHLRFAGFLAALVSTAVIAAAAAAPGAAPSDTGQWVLSLLPRSFQQNPFVDQTVITEMTDEGRRSATPTAAAPVYYATDVGGLHHEGFDGANGLAPSPDAMLACLQRALAVNHYLPATPAHPPALLLVVFWGAHNNPNEGSDEIGGPFPDVAHRNLLSRAALVGGARFAAELRQALDDHDRNRDQIPAPNLDPLYLFLHRSYKNERLYEQTRANCYFVIASAYDYPAATRRERKLLWRSKMSVDSTGIAMADTLPALVDSAAPFLGRDMSEAATLVRRVQRHGEVKLGPLDVKGYLDATAPAKPPAKP